MSNSDYYYFRGMLNELKSHTTHFVSHSTDLDQIESACNQVKDNTQFVNSRLNNIQNKLAENSDGSGQTAGQLLNTSNTNISSIVTATKATRENQTLAGVSALTVYGSNNGTSIDMDGYRHLVIKVRSSATTGSSPLQNLRLYYSLDDSDFTIGEIVAQNELPGSSGNYQGIVRLENVGFRYIRLFSIGVTASPTAYYVYYSRSN